MFLIVIIGIPALMAGLFVRRLNWMVLAAALAYILIAVGVCYWRDGREPPVSMKKYGFAPAITAPAQVG